MLTPGDLLWLVLQPSSVIVALLLLAAVALLLGGLKAGRRLLWFALVLLFLPAVLPIEETLLAPLERAYAAPQTLPERVDGILVLGGAVDWRVSEALQQLNTNEAAERVFAGAALARRYPEARLVFTGVYGSSVMREFVAYPEAQSFIAGSEYAQRRPIFFGGARSTYEDALYSLENLKPRSGEQWLLVTSAMHMPRAFMTFQTLGWTLIPYPVDYRSDGNFRPSLRVIARLASLDTVVREWGALLVYKNLGRIKQPLPRL